MNILRSIKISASTLKIIALITMITDHTGMLLFPEITFLRIIGRISFPIYAFLIGEGCIHTRNKFKYFLKVFITFVAYQIVDYLIYKQIKICVLFGFLLFIAFAISMDWARKDWNKRFILPELIAIFSCIIVIIVNSSYLFFSFFLPFIAYTFKNHNLKCLLYFISLIILGFCYSWVQFFGILSFPLIFLYSGEKGKLKIKNLFYIMYPLHYFILGAIQYFINLWI